MKYVLSWCAGLWVMSTFAPGQEEKMLGDVPGQISLWSVKGASADPLVGIPLASAVSTLHRF